MESAATEEIAPLSEADARQAADLQLVHAMLGEMAEGATEERRLRIERVMDAVRGPKIVTRGWRSMRLVRWAAVAAVVAVGLTAWRLSESPATAAAALQQMIRATEAPLDRVYLITTEMTGETKGRSSLWPGTPPGPKRTGPKMRETVSTDVPPEGGAMLYVRGSQYVLERQTENGGKLITGSNGRESWSIGPDGAIQVSSDPLGFRGPMPALETRIPFVDIRSGLRQIESSYDLQLMSPWKRHGQEANVLQRLRADRRSDDPAQPQIIHVWYHGDSGLVQQIQMDGMSRKDYPRLTRLTVELIEQRELGADWFEHTAHHDPQRPVRRIDATQKL
jgi:hypothetical protein